MSHFTFFDSRPGQPPKFDGREIKPSMGLLYAIDKLNDAAREGKLQVQSVSGKRRAYTQDMPEIITYKVTEIGSK